MFKPTAPLFRRLRRLALTTKMVNGGYYKGTGSGSMGRHTKHGGYIIEWDKVRNYIVPPNLAAFKVRVPCSYAVCTPTTLRIHTPWKVTREVNENRRNGK